ncbi:XdhC family protein [Cellulophaga sp. Hel_I_12]|uniref:XdhC family protein n=1 Tax=Cellulophaga sp. Hel_I_12 TaxID=1249972 RepID=UPI000645C8C4|nr:XdhC/CoxI family protein [Cellulophaga sp. Hel_I_12]
MTHEFIQLVEQHQLAKKNGLKSLLVTVVALDGSSYRKPGVRMLLLENGNMVGAVSGGCVEKEIIRQAASVFELDIPKIMTYDGRFRLGCEGILYILIEPFAPSELFISTFNTTIKDRIHFKISSFYKKEDLSEIGFGTRVQFQTTTLPVSIKHAVNTELKVFEQRMLPCFRLLIFGTEHDAVQLCSFASHLGWDVHVIAHPLEEKTIENFPGISKLVVLPPDQYQGTDIDNQTAIVLMNHSYAKDLLFLMALKDTTPAYIGLLGSSKRREKLLADLLEQAMEVNPSFFDVLHGPAGLNLGAISAQEIAVSILSEILAVTRDQVPKSLKDKNKGILD